MFARLLGFRRREDGAIAVQFAILIVPIIALVFGLIDINRASVEKRNLQDSLDAAALIAARSGKTTQADVNTVGVAALKAELGTRYDAVLVESGQIFTLGGTNNTTVIAKATVAVKPIIAHIWLNGDMMVAAKSEVIRSMNQLEVVMVLDNTGSMTDTLGSGKKIDALKTAANGLVDTLKAAATRSSIPDPIKLAVVPFSSSVNVGTANKTATWITPTLPAAYGADIFATSQNRYTMLTNMGISWGGCVESRPAPYDITETAPNSGTPASMFVPYFAPDEPDANTMPTGQYDWRGTPLYYPVYNDYITKDKTTSSDWMTRLKYVAKYGTASLDSSAKTSTTKGPNAYCSPTPIRRLTTDFASVKSTITAMAPQGDTNVPMGLMWGWHVLSPNTPFADGKAYTTEHLTKIVILLTDGDNTNGSRANPNGSIYAGIGYAWQKRLLKAGSTTTYVDKDTAESDRTLALNDRQAKLCANMKAKGVIIYAIGVGVSASSKTLLQSCSSGNDYYFDVTNTSQLTAVFDTIAGAIANLRISK